MRRGVTLLELAVTLVLFSLVFALVARAAVFHERVQRHERAAIDGARAARQTVAIVASVLVGAGADDLVVDQSSDSALDVMAPVASGLGCLDDSRLVVAGDADGGGSPFARWNASPREGDRLLIYDDRHVPSAWVARTIERVDANRGDCVAFGTSAGTTTVLWLDASVMASPLVAFRVSRRTRFTLYRGGDSFWYLGMREWNSTTGGLSGVQPVAGPLHARSTRAEWTGLQFGYVDSLGNSLRVPLVTEDVVAGVVITARSADSAGTTVRRMIALHHAH